MELSIFDVILGPVMSEKSSSLIDEQKKISLMVHPKANKIMIKSTLQALFKGVEVEAINIIVRKGKARRFKGIASRGGLKKIAIVTLKDEKSFDILTQAGSNSAVSAQKASVGSEQTSS